MYDLWGEPLPQPQPQKQKPPAKLADVVSTSQDCYFFGHAFMPFGMNNEKICQVCHVKAYCPCCTPVKPSKTAVALFCTKHSQGRIQA